MKSKPVTRTTEYEPVNTVARGYPKSYENEFWRHNPKSIQTTWDPNAKPGKRLTGEWTYGDHYDKVTDKTYQISEPHDRRDAMNYRSRWVDLLNLGPAIAEGAAKSTRENLEAGRLYAAAKPRTSLLDTVLGEEDEGQTRRVGNYLTENGENYSGMLAKLRTLEDHVDRQEKTLGGMSSAQKGAWLGGQGVSMLFNQLPRGSRDAIHNMLRRGGPLGAIQDIEGAPEWLKTTGASAQYVQNSLRSLVPGWKGVKRVRNRLAEATAPPPEGVAPSSDFEKYKAAKALVDKYRKMKKYGKIALGVGGGAALLLGLWFAMSRLFGGSAENRSAPVVHNYHGSNAGGAPIGVDARRRVYQ